MKPWYERFRIGLIKWRIAPLAVLAALGYWTQMSMLKLSSFSETTDITQYGTYAGVVTILLGFQFQAFKMLFLNKEEKEDNDVS